MPDGGLLESFSALADPTRCRMLLVLERHELTVSELCVVLQLPQSTVSRHLKLLADASLVISRRDGTSRYYSLALNPGRLPSSDGLPKATEQSELWRLARRALADRPGAAQDTRRLERVLAARGDASRRFFATSAGQWDRLRDELFGAQFYRPALLGLLPPTWVVADLGCGTGAVLLALRPHVARLIGVDSSEEMLAAAAARLEGTDRVSSAGRLAETELRRGSLEALPIEDGTLDAATLVLVLHHLPTPGAALSEAHRVLKPGGRLLVVDMAPHEREEYRQQMGHVWLGFAEEQLRRLLVASGFDDVRLQELMPETEAKGPALFAASAVKSS
jgi:ArsR family transcriptional regulator